MLLPDFSINSTSVIFANNKFLLLIFPSDCWVTSQYVKQTVNNIVNCVDFIATEKNYRELMEVLGHSLSPQSLHRMSLPLATKRLLDKPREHILQLKQYSCQELPS